MTRDAEIVQALRIERRARRISGRSIARQLGVHSSTLSNWEYGRYPPGADDLERWCRALGFRLMLEPAAELAAYQG